jgi:hypothetical protein
MKNVKDDLRNTVEEMEQVEKRSLNQQKNLEAHISSLNRINKKTSDQIKKLFIKEEILNKKKKCIVYGFIFLGLIFRFFVFAEIY